MPASHGFPGRQRPIGSLIGSADHLFKPGNRPSPAVAAPCPGQRYNGGMELSERQRKYLRGLAHPLEPVIMVGNAGVTEAVVRETARALYDHELIKVKIRGADRQARDAAFDSLAQRTGSTLVHRIGHVGVLYQRNPALARILIPDT